MPFNNRTIVTLCGSTRFYEQFVEANYRETMRGSIVLSIGFARHRPDVYTKNFACTEEQKASLDHLHLDKIALSDEILVLNVDGYIGDSTKKEIAFAIFSDKRVRFLEEDKGEAYLEANARALGAYAPEFLKLYR